MLRMFFPGSVYNSKFGDGWSRLTVIEQSMISSINIFPSTHLKQRSSFRMARNISTVRIIQGRRCKSNETQPLRKKLTWNLNMGSCLTRWPMLDEKSAKNDIVSSSEWISCGDLHPPPTKTGFFSRMPLYCLLKIIAGPNKKHSWTPHP